MDALLHDLRYGVRNLRRSWFFTAVTMLTLGLGIGVVTALFAIVNAVLLHPLAVDQERVVRIWKQDVQRGAFPHSLSYHEFKAWRDETRSFEALAAINYADASTTALTIDGEPVPISLAPVSVDFFRVLFDGAPLYGRWLQSTDEEEGAELAAVVSERFWRPAAGGDPTLVGRRLTWGGDHSLIVIGVAPAEFDYPLNTDIWVPIARYFAPGVGPFNFDIESRKFWQFELVGRLKRGTSVAQAPADLQVIERRLTAAFPDDYRPMPVIVELCSIPSSATALSCSCSCSRVARCWVSFC